MNGSSGSGGFRPVPADWTFGASTPRWPQKQEPAGSVTRLPVFATPRRPPASTNPSYTLFPGSLRRITSHHGLINAAGVALLTLAVFGPLLRPGTVLFLDYGDYPVGPHPHLSGYLWGLAPGLTSRAPITALLVGLFQPLDWGPFRLLPFLLVPFLVACGFARLFAHRPLPTLAATLLYVVNPFMYDRMQAGQVYLVLGFALLPLLASLLWPREPRSFARAIAAGLLFAVLIALAPNFLFVAGLLILVFAIGAATRRDLRALLSAGTTIGTTVLVGLYWVVPALTSTGQLQRITRTDLPLFRTTSDPHVGLYGNVAGLYGFWRQEWPPAKLSMVGWPVFLLAILFVASIGLVSAWRSPTLRLVAVALGVAGVIGYFLALGDRGPTGAVFLWMFDHVPEFRIMREPQKFVGLLALAYAFCFGLGVEAFATETIRRRVKVTLLALLFVLPALYTFRAFWGFNGYVQPSHLPSSWAEADRVMGTGEDKALALPWHLYARLDLAQGRVVANPMSSSFRREVIAGDNAEYGPLQTQGTSPRSRFLQFAVRNGWRIDRFGALIAPLDVKYVLLVRHTDWKAYSWLYRQKDLRLIHRWPDLSLFENLEPLGRAFAPSQAIELEDWGEVIGLAEHHRLTDFAITVRHSGPGSIRVPVTPVPPPSQVVSITKDSPSRYEVEGRSSAPLVLAEPFDPGWRYRGFQPRPFMGVTNLFPTGSMTGSSIEYGPWTLVRASYAASACSVLLVLAALASWKGTLNAP